MKVTCGHVAEGQRCAAATATAILAPGSLGLNNLPIGSNPMELRCQIAETPQENRRP
jgi:hypothetical protein